MAITRAQQVKQMLRDGGRIGFQGGGKDMGSTGSSTGPGGQSPGPGGQKGGSNTGPGGGGNNNNTGGNGGNNYQDRIQRIAEQKKREKKAADERAARNRENARVATQIKKKKEKEKRDREEKEAKDLSNLGKSTTTKFGTTTKPGTRSSKKTGIATATKPNRFLTDTYLDDRSLEIEDDSRFDSIKGQTASINPKFYSGIYDKPELDIFDSMESVFGTKSKNTINPNLTASTIKNPNLTSSLIDEFANDKREKVTEAALDFIVDSARKRGQFDDPDDIRQNYGRLDYTYKGKPPKGGDLSSDLQTAINDLQTGRYNAELDDLLPGDEFTPGADVDLNKREKILQDFKDRRNEVKAFSPLTAILKNPLQKFADFSAKKNRAFFEDVIRAGKIPGLNFDMSAKDLEKAYKGYLSDRSMGKIDAYGNTLGDFRRENIGGQSVIMGGGGGGGAGITSATPTPSLLPVEEEVDNRTELEKLLDARGAAYRFFAEGGRVPAMAGGIMNPDIIGGAADGNIDEMGRQMYFVGKLVKKATNAVKKIVKSPVGKIALLTAGAGLFGAGPAASLFGSGKGLAFKNFLGKGLLKKGMTDFSLANISPMKAIGLASLTPFLFPGQEEEEEPQDKGPSIDIAAIRRDPYKYMGETYRFAADGGLMRTGYAEGSKEPVAKKTMPLIDMDGKEMDLRDEGGFVPLGRMERADDVPARLSKKEFVFTADAVRNAGEGNIDKGAEVMYNMMKNLESGGEVSEESQGLDGAREMFKTSQRLGEVI